MKRVLLAACAALGLSACAEGYYGPYGGGGPAYYDDFYGPYYNGYWGSDGFFYYGDGRRGFHRDEGHHFQHAPMQGFHGVHPRNGFHGFHGGGMHGDRPHGDRPHGDRPHDGGGPPHG